MGKTEEITRKALLALDLTQTRGTKKQEAQRREQGIKPIALENEKPGGARLPHREEDLRLCQGQAQKALEKTRTLSSCSLPCRTCTWSGGDFLEQKPIKDRKKC